MLIEIWKSIKGLWQMKYLYTWTRARWSIYMLVTFLYKSKTRKSFVSLLKAQTYCNSLDFFKNKNIFFWTQTLWLEMSPTSNSLEKVLVVWSSMTCFTNCFTVSGSWPSGTQDWILTTSWYLSLTVTIRLLGDPLSMSPVANSRGVDGAETTLGDVSSG